MQRKRAGRQGAGRPDHVRGDFLGEPGVLGGSTYFRVYFRL